MFIKRLAIVVTLIATSLGGTLWMTAAQAQPSDRESFDEQQMSQRGDNFGGYCGHGSTGRRDRRITYVRSRNMRGSHWHLYFYDLRHGRDYYEWKRCPSHSGGRF